MTMRIGIFGGSFNPPHNAHLQLCKYAKETAFLDKIILIPTGDNPFKKSDNTVERIHRLEMTRIAVEHLQGFEVDPIEIEREGRSYTYDTIKELTATSDDTFYFISGSDLLFQLPDWKNFKALACLIGFISICRKGIDNQYFLEEAEKLFTSFNATIIACEDYAPDEISSSVIRKMIKQNEDITLLVPKAVNKYIIEHNLYH